MRLAAFLQFMLPGMASIYYGDEAGMEGGEDSFCRRYYPWGEEDEALRSYFAALCRVKNETPALRDGDVRVRQAGGGKLCFVRRIDACDAEVYVNQSQENWQLPENGELRFGGGIAWTDTAGITLRPGGFALLLRRKD